MNEYAYCLILLSLQFLSLGMLFSPLSLLSLSVLSSFHLKAFCLMNQSKDQIICNFFGGVSPNFPRKMNSSLLSTLHSTYS